MKISTRSVLVCYDVPSNVRAILFGLRPVFSVLKGLMSAMKMRRAGTRLGRTSVHVTLDMKEMAENVKVMFAMTKNYAIGN